MSVEGSIAKKCSWAYLVAAVRRLELRGDQ